MKKLDNLGFGLGLRSKHYETVLTEKPDLDWFEIVTEDYLVEGGQALTTLEEIRRNYPIVMHGVSMSIGSADPLNWDYLKQVKNLSKHIQASWISDHLCWTGVNGVNTHDLLPLPYTEEVIHTVTERIKQVQDFFGQRILIENPSSYVSFAESTLPEWAVMRAIAEEADCLILLDINNIYVSSFNHGFDPQAYLQGIPIERVQQFHLAGHLNRGNYIIDTHDAAIIDPVWSLYRDAVKRFGSVATMIERDDNIPPLQELLDELAIAKDIAAQVLQPPQPIDLVEA